MAEKLTPAALAASLQQIALHCSPETERAIRGHIETLKAEVAQLRDTLGLVHGQWAVQAVTAEKLQQQLAASQLREHQLRCVSDRLRMNLRDAATLYPEHFLKEALDQLFAEWDGLVTQIDTLHLAAYVAEQTKELREALHAMGRIYRTAEMTTNLVASEMLRVAEEALQEHP